MIIEALRADGEPKLLLLAADRLEELERELTETIRERYKTVAELIKQRDEANAEVQRLNQQLANAPQVRPEPSRLEIAAMAMQGKLADGGYEAPRLASAALRYADALIAAAKGAK
jgi:hypothetical protein